MENKLDSNYKIALDIVLYSVVSCSASYLDLVGPTCASYSSQVQPYRRSALQFDSPKLPSAKQAMENFIICMFNLFFPEPLETCPMTVPGITGH